MNTGRYKDITIYLLLDGSSVDPLVMDAKDTVTSVMRHIDSEGVDMNTMVKGRDGLTEQLQVAGIHAIDWHQFINI